MDHDINKFNNTLKKGLAAASTSLERDKAKSHIENALQVAYQSEIAHLSKVKNAQKMLAAQDLVKKNEALMTQIQSLRSRLQTVMTKNDSPEPRKEPSLIEREL